MARLLAYTPPAAGHLYPLVGTLLELRHRGHDVHVRTRAADAARLAALGLNAAPVDAGIAAIEIDDSRARTATGALARLYRAYGRRGELEIGDLRAAIEAVGPDALIVDVGCEGALAAAEASGLPWATSCPFPLVFRDDPPYGPGLKPARGPLGRARDRAALVLIERVALRHLPSVNALRTRAGLDPVRHLDDMYLRAPSFLVFTAEPFEYPRTDWPAAVRFVGPGTWAPDAEPPSWLGGETRPLVLVTASTERQGDDRLIATALEALAGEDVAIVATTGAQDPDAFDVPPNARVERFLAHAPLLERAVCVVSHGGMGITQASLAAGVPVCVVPFARDQFEVARRVETARAGVRLHHRRLTARRLRHAVRTATTMRPGAERIAAAFARAGGASAAADAIEELVAR